MVHQYVGAQRAGENQDREKAHRRRGAESRPPRPGRRRVRQRDRHAQQRHREEHHNGKVVYAVPGEFRPLKPQNLAGERDGPRERFQLAPTEAEGFPIHAREHGDSRHDERAAQEYLARRPTPLAQRDPDWNEQAIALRQKRRRGGRRVRQPVDLKQDSDAAEEAQAQPLREFRASELWQGARREEREQQRRNRETVQDAERGDEPRVRARHKRLMRGGDGLCRGKTQGPQRRTEQEHLRRADGVRVGRGHLVRWV